MFDVITIGSATKDLFLKTKSSKVLEEKRSHHDFICFEYGGKIDVEDIFVQTGGAATNVAVSFARLGLKVAALTKVGVDEAGFLVESVLKKEKVNTSLLLKGKDFATATSVVLTSAAGERTIFTYRGASSHISRRELNFKTLKAKCFYFSSLSDESLRIIPLLLAHAKKVNAVVAMNPGAAQLEGRKNLLNHLKLVDVFILNKEEFERVIGRSLKSDLEFLKAFEFLESLGVRVVAVTDGAEKIRVYANKRVFVVKPFDVKKVNTLGAGDAFASAFVFGLIEGLAFEEAIKYGCLNASSVIQHLGAKVGLLKKEQFKRYERSLKELVIK